MEQSDWDIDIEGDGATINGYNGDAGDLVIPGTYMGKPVTAIGNGAFYGCTGLSSVVIPDGVTVIGSGVFCGCDNLSDKDRETIKRSGVKTCLSDP